MARQAMLSHAGEGQNTTSSEMSVCLTWGMAPHARQGQRVGGVDIGYLRGLYKPVVRRNASGSNLRATL
jgi:hypothetical protein